MKVKRGEKHALRLIDPSLHARITPLLEVVEITEGKTLREHLNTAFDGLAESLHPYQRCFLDPRELGDRGDVASDAVFNWACQRGIVFTPVTGVSGGRHVAVALKYGRNGVALRLTRDEFERRGLGQRVTDLIRDYDLAVEDTDLIVDLGAVENLVPEGVARLAEAFLGEVPSIRAWRTLTLSGCAFPLSMRGVEPDSYAVSERSEWLGWKYLHGERVRLARLPAFSDCAIQRPEGVEGFDFSIDANIGDRTLHYDGRMAADQGSKHAQSSRKISVHGPCDPARIRLFEEIVSGRQSLCRMPTSEACRRRSWGVWLRGSVAPLGDGTPHHDGD